MFAKGDAEQGLEAILTAVAKVLPEDPENIRGIGICSAGPLDPNAGVVLNPPNLPCWSNYPLVEMVRRKFPFPVKLDNDANGAALAEARWGAGRGYKNVFHVTL